jgi:molybdenum cofactor biosynthesis enzyme MoaA
MLVEMVLKSRWSWIRLMDKNFAISCQRLRVVSLSGGAACLTKKEPSSCESEMIARMNSGEEAYFLEGSGGSWSDFFW